jgi:hypothetical protein
MRIFVTMRGGFVGSHLVHVFAAGGADAIAPAAIWNDPTMLSSQRRRA